MRTADNGEQDDREKRAEELSHVQVTRQSPVLLLPYPKLRVYFMMPPLIEPNLSEDIHRCFPED